MKEAEGKKGLGRHLRAETFIALAGVGCIVGGVVDGIRVMPVFYGICILIGSAVLHLVKKKDWDKHWAEQERIQRSYEERMAEEKKRKG